MRPLSHRLLPRVAPIVALASLAVGAGGCRTKSPHEGEDCAQDGSCPDGLKCFPDWVCRSSNADPDCTPSCFGSESYCDKRTLRCVACLADSDCLLGYVCVPPIMRCQRGCSEVHPQCTSAAEKCDVDMGVCRGCLLDTECTDHALPRCDPDTGRCVPCIPDGDNCPAGQYCGGTNGNYVCVQGCKGPTDCDGAADGGVALVDCCDHRCVVTGSDSNNCGGCGVRCRNNNSCCDGECVDLTADLDNCGACGHSCEVPNVLAPECAASTCTNKGCESYFSNCDGNWNNGCEVNLTADPNNCYSCGYKCPPFEHAMPGCTVSGCSLGPCLAGWADCNKNQYDGCEYDVTGFATDPRNCGRCGAACGLNQSCVNGQCR